MNPGTDASEYLDAIQFRLAISPIVTCVDIVQAYAMDDRGFFRAKLQLANTDFLEVSEYFEVRMGNIEAVEYRYQWMDAHKQALRKRWDNAAHHPGLANFPHHIHVQSELHIEPGLPISIVQLIQMLEQELQDQP